MKFYFSYRIIKKYQYKRKIMMKIFKTLIIYNNKDYYKKLIIYYFKLIKSR